MKLHHLIAALTTALSLSAPIAAQAKDKHDDRHDDHDHDHDRHHGHYSGHYYGHGSYYYSHPLFGVTVYHHPSVVYRSGPVYGDRLAVDVQSELRHRGYYHGAVDGDIGPGSRAAIRAYQYNHGLYVTGRIDSSLLHSLGIG